MPNTRTDQRRSYCTSGRANAHATKHMHLLLWYVVCGLPVGRCKQRVVGCNAWILTYLTACLPCPSHPHPSSRSNQLTSRSLTMGQTHTTVHPLSLSWRTL